MVHPILARIVAGEYELGVRWFEASRDVSPEDERFAGVCLYNLHELQRAKSLLLRARARGCDAAGIELATVYRHLGHLDVARDVLAAVRVDRAAPFDRALALRERGVQLYTTSALPAACDVLERAWAAAHESPLRHALLPSIGHALGIAYAARGLDRHAASALESAALHAHPGRAAQLRAARAACLAYLGRPDEAEAEIAAAAAGAVHVPLLRPYLRYVAGVVAVVRGRLDEADERFRDAAVRARAAQEPETECYAELGRCAVATATDRITAASAHLARAAAVAVGEKGRVSVRLREGALATRRADASAVETLTAAAAGFARLGLLREQASAALHLAEAHLRAGTRSEAAVALDRASALHHALGDGASLLSELQFLPSVVAHLAGSRGEPAAQALVRDVRRLDTSRPRRLELRTLGRSELVLDGSRVRLDLRRSVEVLAYLVRRAAVTMDEVLLDLFPEADAPHGRSYFHQVRYELARAVPGLAVPFDRASRSYRVHLEGLTLDWDAQALRDAVARGAEAGLEEALRRYVGAFLPSADGEWVRAERDDVAWSTVELGLRIVAERFAQGRHASCTDLIVRLRDIDPYDERLDAALVQAARAVEGEEAALHVVERLAQRFVRDLGTVPPHLERLGRAS